MCEYNYVDLEEDHDLDTSDLDIPPEINISEDSLLIALRNDPNFVAAQHDVIGAICMLCKTSYLDRYGCMKHFRSRDGHPDLMKKLDHIALQNHCQKVKEGQAKAEDGTRAKPQMLIDRGLMRVNLINPARYRRIEESPIEDAINTKTKHWLATMSSWVREQATMISVWFRCDPHVLRAKLAVSLLEQSNYTELDDLPKSNRLIALFKRLHSEADTSIPRSSDTEDLDPTELVQRYEASMNFLDEMSRLLLTCPNYLAASPENIQAAQECLRQHEGQLRDQFFYEVWENRVKEILSCHSETVDVVLTQQMPDETGSPGREAPDPTVEAPEQCSLEKAPIPCLPDNIRTNDDPSVECSKPELSEASQIAPAPIPCLPDNIRMLDKTEEPNDDPSVECSKPELSEASQIAPEADDVESSAEMSDQGSAASASTRPVSTEPVLVRLKRRSRKTMVNIANQALPKRVKAKTPTATILKMVEHDGDLEKVAQLLDERTKE